MNIYQKLQACRCELQAMNLRKSGANKFAGYTYYELSDFLPQVNELFKNHGLCPVVSFDADNATMTIVDMDAPDGERIVITSPMSSASLKACHEVQNLGAVQTYLRRYLYTAALEIVEHDPLDATTGKPQDAPPSRRGAAPKARDMVKKTTTPPAKQSTPKPETTTAAGAEHAQKITAAQRRKIFAELNKYHFHKEWFKEYVCSKYGVDSTGDLTQAQGSAIIEMLITSPDTYEAWAKEKHGAV